MAITEIKQHVSKITKRVRNSFTVEQPIKLDVHTIAQNLKGKDPAHRVYKRFALEFARVERDWLWIALMASVAAFCLGFIIGNLTSTI